MPTKGQYTDADVAQERYTDADVVPDGQNLTPSGQPMRPLPERTPDALDLVQKTPQFFGDLGRAAKKNLSDAWQGVKSNFTDAGKTLKEDPTRIVPMWFGGGMKALASAGNTVATPVTYALQGDISSAVSSAAGGDPEQAQKYAQEGNAGGEFWEMAGKPLLLIAGGEALGKVGGGLSEGASVNRLRVVRGMMSDASAGKAGIDLADAQLAQQALQDAARETYGVGKKGESSLAKALPGRDLNLSNIIKGEPGTVSVVDQGNKALRNLTRKAVDLAGRPADEVNNLYGYLPGKDASLNIQRNLISQAEEAERNGLTSYGRALRERAAALDNKNTLGQIYDVKKSANRMAGVARNTQEAIDLMDSWSALASAIRQEVYPRYQQMVGGEFNLAQAGRKEGAAMSLRNGVEKRMARVQEQTDALHTPGETLSQMQHGITKHHTVFGTAVREAREHGILPSPEGELNKSGRKAIGRLSPGTVPESVKVEKGATFSAAAPTRLALPGKAMQFEIPGNLPTLGREGQIAHSAAQVPRHSFESPAYTTSSAPTRTSSFAPNGRIIAGPEGSAGADFQPSASRNLKPM